MRAGFAAHFAAVLSFVTVLPGCAARVSTFDITDFREPGDAKRYRETFDEGYYALDGDGNVDVVLCRMTAPGDDAAGREINQVIHIRSVWRSIPGDTVSHATQINATVRYHILSGRVGAAFEGAGSVFFSRDLRSDELTGTLELAKLRPKGRVAAANSLFRHAEIAGAFVARHDPRRVVQIVNEMNRRFEPTPRGPE